MNSICVTRKFQKREGWEERGGFTPTLSCAFRVQIKGLETDSNSRNAVDSLDDPLLRLGIVIDLSKVLQLRALGGLISAVVEHGIMLHQGASSREGVNLLLFTLLQSAKNRRVVQRLMACALCDFSYASWRLKNSLKRTACSSTRTRSYRYK